jgi:hypothetical protein
MYINARAVFNVNNAVYRSTHWKACWWKFIPGNRLSVLVFAFRFELVLTSRLSHSGEGLVSLNTHSYISLTSA